MQTKPLRLDPTTGAPMTEVASAAQHREANPGLAWLFDPWSGRRRGASELLRDPRGMDIVPAEGLLIASMGDQEPGMSMFATREDYWRNMCEYLSNELVKVAVALGVGRTEDIYRQIERIRLIRENNDALDRVLNGMEAGAAILAGDSAVAHARVLHEKAEEAEDIAIRQAIEKAHGEAPEDCLSPARVRELSRSGPVVHMGFDGEYLISLMPPRLLMQEDEQEGGKRQIFSQAVDFFDVREAVK